MKLANRNLLRSSVLLGLVSVGVYACGSSNSGGTGTGGSSTAGAGGTATGGQTRSGGTTSAGGSMSSGGTTSSGGVLETGGTVGTGGSGGTKATGGSSSSSVATGGSSSGGVGAGGSGSGGSSSSMATGGTGTMPAGGTGGKLPGTGGMSPGTGGAARGDAGVGGKVGTSDASGGGTGGTTSSGTCTKGQIKPAEVVIMGESFYAIDPQYIEKRIESDAQTAGALASGAKYRNVAVSGQNMNYIATTEWTAATQGGASVKNVIMDGGGIDCLTGGGSGGCTTCPDTFKTLLGKMVTAGVQDVIYTRYPEPGNPPGSNTTLKANLDILMPKMQTVCAGTTSPRCHWVDLRPVWVNGDTSDGLHPTQSGGEHVGDAIWAEMVKDCIAQ